MTIQQFQFSRKIRGFAHLKDGPASIGLNSLKDDLLLKCKFAILSNLKPLYFFELLRL